jgi:hypothetical protein
MKQIKLLFLIILSLILILFISFDQTKININNLSIMNMQVKLKDESEIEFNNNEYQVMLKFLFQDKNFYPSVLKEEYLQIINKNKEFLDNEYDQFLQYFINFLKTHKKYKYSEDKFNDKEYVKQRLYIIISNAYNFNLPIWYLQIIDKPTDEKELETYNKLFTKNIFSDIVYYLLNTLKKFKQKKDFQEFFKLFSSTINNIIDDINLVDKSIYFINEFNYQFNYMKIDPRISGIYNIYICFFNEILCYKNSEISLEQLSGCNDISDGLLLVGGEVGIIRSFFNTSSIKFYPSISIIYNLIEDKDLFLLIYFHELTHLFQNITVSGYNPIYNFPENLNDNSKLLKYFSIFNSELALNEFDAEFTSIYAFTNLNKNINFNDNDEFKNIINFSLLFKYLLFKYLEFAKTNNVDKLFSIQDLNSYFPYKNLEIFLKDYYKIRFEESRKIAKFLSNIMIMEDY